MNYNFVNMEVSAKKLTKYLVSRGVDAKIKVSRYQSQIKAVELASALSLEKLMPSLMIEADISDLTPTEEASISGKYKAKLLKVKKSVENINIGETLFILNTFTEKGSIKNKDLAPDKLSLTSSRYTKLEDFDLDVMNGIKELKVPSEIKTAIISLYENVSSNKEDQDSIPLTEQSKKALSVIKPQDRQVIGKDFGEVLSLRWYVTQKFGRDYTSFYFSELSNEALIDFVVETKKDGKIIRRDVSAKFEAGAAPSIVSIGKNIDKVYIRPNPEEKKACDVLKALAGLSGTRETTSMKILQAYNTLNLPAYKKLKETVGIKTDITVSDIQDHIQGIIKGLNNPKDRITEFLRVYKPFYDVLGSGVDNSSLSTVFAGSTYKKYFSLVMSPMGYALVAYMNKQPIYQEVLNNISREMDIDQVYLDITNNYLMFKKKLFSKSEFKFDYGANAKDSDNTGIKFSMK